MFKQFTREKLANLKFYNLTKREVNKFQIFLLLEIRFSSLCEFQLISTKEPQAQRIRYTYLLYVSTAYLYIDIYISIRSPKTSQQTTTQQLVSKCDITGKQRHKNGFRRCGLFFLFLICQCELRGERPNVHLPSLVGQRPHQQYRM